MFNMRDMSLLEQKKLQWAKEKEELSKLNDFFSAATTTTTKTQFERTSIRTYYSNVDMSSSTNSSVKSSTMPRRSNYYQQQAPAYELPHNYHKSSSINPRHNSCRTFVADSGTYANDSQYQPEHMEINNRAPVLPPIGHSSRAKPTQTRQNHFVHTDEETSGYLSDRMSPLMWANQPHRIPKDFSNYIYPSSGDELAPEMDAMKIDERRRIQKHKRDIEPDDNGHETDFSMPKTPSSLCSDNTRNYSRFSTCPPSRKEKEERAKWGDRHNNFYDTVSSSGVKSDGPCWLERGFVDSGDESSVKSYSFIRGQNAPIDPNVLAERTTRRIKALELQNAIKAQVEERERIRQIEMEKMRMEERRQEEKLRQQMESNEQRFEEEQRKTREKLEREQRKQEVMRIAIEKARQEAELEKAKRKRCPSVELRDSDTHDDADVETTRVVVPQTPPTPFDAENDDDADDAEDTDDGEKILIGTPIKMRKKTLNKVPPTKKEIVSAKKEASVQSDKDVTAATASVSAPETNVDGIALVLQTLPPIMPILSNDIINLNQNINTLNTNNIQLAVMLAHQMQQLNSMAQGQNHAQSTVAQEVDDKRPLEMTNGNDVCKHCTPTLNGTEQEEHESHTKDAATVTDDDLSRVDQQKTAAFQMLDAATQTDKKMAYCFQCRYQQCHQHHPTKDNGSSCSEVGNEKKGKSFVPEKECSVVSTAVGTRNACVEHQPMKIEDRPKWGVNRPMHQYVKASERDPFYLRNKRKKHPKQRSDDPNCSCDGGVSGGDGPKEDFLTEDSRSISPSPSIITNGTVTLSSPQLKNRKRSICTEILPIKTDMNGRVYLNFNGASLQVTEDDRPSSKRPQKARMINRSQTANSIRAIDNELRFDDEALID